MELTRRDLWTVRKAKGVGLGSRCEWWGSCHGCTPPPGVTQGDVGLAS